MIDLITDDELLNLPEDPTEAFLQFHQIVEARLDEQLAHTSSEAEDEALFRNYMTLVIAAADEYGIEGLKKWQLPDWAKSNSASYRPFREAVHTFTTSFRFKRIRRLRKYSVALDPAAKEKLRHLLQQMRKTVDKLDISVAKKDRLYRCINELQYEVDLERTSVQAFGALVIEICDDIGEAAKRLHPVVEIVERIGAALGYSKRQEDEQASLPKPQETKRLSGPKQSAETNDDEIPF